LALNGSAARLIAVLATIVSLGAVAPAAQATFPGKNGKIAFSVFHENPALGFGNDDIYTVDPDGTGVTNLTSSTARSESLPAWSADGTRIAFYSRHEPSSEDHTSDGIWIMNADGSEPHLVLAAAVYGGTLTWSPDGRKIAFAQYGCAPSFSSCSTSLYTVSVDGTGLTELMPAAQAPCGPGCHWADDFDPAWSPDGKTIAFISDRDPSSPTSRSPRYRLFTMSPDGTGLTNLEPSASDQFGPDWSPDSQRLAFVKTPDGFPQVYVMDADGTGEARLTDVPGFSAANPSWAPDGTEIVFNVTGHVCGAQCESDLYTVKPDGTALDLLLGPGSHSVNPAWQPIPAPKLADYKNTLQFCKAEQAFWGDQFDQRYRSFGQCVSTGSR
jgi:Tol biopolymer transport system component